MKGNEEETEGHKGVVMWPYYLLPFIPVAIVLDLFTNVDPTWVFVTAALGVIPTAAMMGLATEELASKTGPGLGGLLNVTFGNAPELIIALFALEAGLQEVVKASIVGSILGNVLLVLGAAMVAGGIGRGGEVQRFDKTAANVQSTMLFLAVAALMMPAIFEVFEGPLRLCSFSDLDASSVKLTASREMLLWMTPSQHCKIVLTDE